MLLLGMSAVFGLWLLQRVAPSHHDTAFDAVSGTIGAAAMFMLFARLSSTFFGVPLWVRAYLAVYAALQPAFVLFAAARDGRSTERELLLVTAVLWVIGLLGKLLVWWSIAWGLESGRLLFVLRSIAVLERRVERAWEEFDQRWLAAPKRSRESRFGS